MRYVSLFSGIEAATVAWEPLGWEPQAFCEIDAFPSAVLKHRYPHVVNCGDITKMKWRNFAKPDVVVGGSPCQSFSVAGKREGLEGASGLMWEYVRAVRELVPRWFVWENVPGALTSAGGADFRCLLEAMAKLGYGMAWRVLDAQFFGVPQRRERVFLVGYLGDPKPASEVLFEREGLRWDFKKGRAKRAELSEASRGSAEARCYEFAGNVIGRRPGNGGNGEGWCDPDERGGYTLTAADRCAVAYSLYANNSGKARSAGETLECSVTLKTDNNSVICLAEGTANAAVDENLCGTVTAHSGRGDPYVAKYAVIRKLTPRECERLQGFPDDWTKVPYRGRPADECPDGPRYKAIGNSMAVPVMGWIGERMQRCEEAMGCWF